MQSLKARMKSRRGASITFALLLFLVCAVVSSVIIVAASAAGGRMSQMRDSDRRYYAVTSAAELLSDVFTAAPAVTVTETKVDGNPTWAAAGGDALMNKAAELIVEAMETSADVNWPSAPSLSVTAEGNTTLNCTVEGVAQQNGQLVFTICNADGRPYKLNLTLASIIKKTTAGAETLYEVTWKQNGVSRVIAGGEPEGGEEP